MKQLWKERQEEQTENGRNKNSLNEIHLALKLRERMTPEVNRQGNE